MSAFVFVDTNVFVYARDSREAAKQRLAEESLERLWKERTGRTSVQVLNECYWNLTRKIKPALSADKAWDLVQSLFEWNPQPIDAAVLMRAREIERSYPLAWWDSLIVGAAQAQNCTILLTEDLQDGAIYGGVTIRNPFIAGVAQIAAEYSAPPISTRPYRGRGRPRSKESRSADGIDARTVPSALGSSKL
jgi:predicted nucleic acid-binding protein